MEHQINEEIRDKEVRLISNDGEQLGIVAIQKAQEIAVDKFFRLKYNECLRNMEYDLDI